MKENPSARYATKKWEKNAHTLWTPTFYNQINLEKITNRKEKGLLEFMIIILWSIPDFRVRISMIYP